MQDIVPVGGGSRKSRGVKQPKRVLRLQYKLPARLRRSIRQEGRRGERGTVGQGEIGFERRPIRTEPPTQRPPSYRRNMGAEHHTGDVYMSSRPEIQISAPPYISSLVKESTAVGARLDGSKTQKRLGPRTENEQSQLRLKRMIKPDSSSRSKVVRLPVEPNRSNRDGRWQGVRDVPYVFAPRRSERRVIAGMKAGREGRLVGKFVPSERLGQTAVLNEMAQGSIKPEASVRLSRRQVAPARREERSWPGKRESLSPAADRDAVGAERPRRGAIRVTERTDRWLERERDSGGGEAAVGLIREPNRQVRLGAAGLVRMASHTKVWLGAVFNRQVAFNTLVLTAGCGLVFGVVWNLQGLGRGWQVMALVQDRTGQAYEQLVSASAALADTNFSASETGFNEAAQLIQQAQTEIEEAMKSSQYVWRYVDLTGTVRSGQEILAAGEQLSVAGGRLAQGADRLVQRRGDQSLVSAIADAKEEFTQAGVALEKAAESLRWVDSVLLPPEVRSQMEQIADSVQRISAVIDWFTTRSDILLAMLGAERDQQYLLLFQNNHEIRPTGGFIGSIGLINVDRGRVEAIDINSVYDPDGQLKAYIEPPEPLKKVTNRWYMRDANWFVNFSSSARKVIDFFEQEGGPTVDGVIALTPEVIRELLRVTGPVVVPGYEVEVSADNFWLVAQDQVSYSYDKQLNKPKQFLADLAPLLLNRLLSGNVDSSLAAIAGIMTMIEEKQLLVYLNNDQWQERLTAVGWSGDVPANKPALLAINNANIAGHKSDQFIRQEVDYRLEVMADGTTEAVVMIKREHRGEIERSDYIYPADENPATKDNVVYQRVLVPKGAKLLEADGFVSPSRIPQMVVPEAYEHMQADEDLVDWQTGQYQHENGTLIGEEAGYTFFANWVVTKPGRTSVVFYRYRLPQTIDQSGVFNPVGTVEAYVIKQPGDLRTTVRVQVDLPENMRLVHTVPGSGITREGDRTMIYRGALEKDLLVGLVFEKVVD